MTGKYCRFAPAIVMVPAATATDNSTTNTTTTNTTSTDTTAPTGTPTIAFVLMCDQNTWMTATIMTFTGTGLAYGTTNVISMAMDVPIMLGTDPAAAPASMVFVVGEPAALVVVVGVLEEAAAWSQLAAAGAVHPHGTCSRAPASAAARSYPDGGHPRCQLPQRCSWSAAPLPRRRG
jgi:hypothetical protein